MRTIKRSFSQIFKHNKQGITKIVLLGAGLAMGLTLIAKVFFENSYENFVPDVERCYRILPIYEVEGVAKNWTETPGGIAPYLKQNCPSIETFTRYSGFFESKTITITDRFGNVSKQGFKAQEMIFADSGFFDIFARHIIAGNAKKILSTPCCALVSSSFASKLMGSNLTANELLGVAFTSETAPQNPITIDGIFEDFPVNSELNNTDIIISLPSLPIFNQYDGTLNLNGNDTYSSFVKLKEGATDLQVDEAIDRLCKTVFDAEKLKQKNIKRGFELKSLNIYHSSNKTVKKMCNVLFILSLAVLITATLNYILIAISAMVEKAKTIAVYKCYGATRRNIYGLLFSEAFVHLLLSIILALFIIFASQDLIKELIGTELSSMITPNSMSLLFGILVVIFFVCAFLPGTLYSRIHVSNAFRRYKESNRKWKHALLFIQFVASSFFISLLLVVMLQYSFMQNNDPGYTYKNLLYVHEQGISKDKKDLLLQEISRLPFVTGQSYCTMLPFHGANGNNIYLTDDMQKYINIADMYDVGNNYFKLLQIPITQGKGFNEINTVTQEVMISERCAEKLSELAGWTDGVIGKSFRPDEHADFNTLNDIYTICGVYKDYMLGYIGDEENRPSIHFHAESDKGFFSDYMSYHLIEVSDVTTDNMQAVAKKIASIIPNKDLQVNSYAQSFSLRYADSRRFRDSIITAGLVVLIITIIGLIGYLHDEINRRRSEIAIRKINGATIGELHLLFLNRITPLTITSVISGSLLSYLVGDRWIEQFSQQITLHWWYFACCAILVIATMVVIMVVTTQKAANANPVENLKNE